MENKNTKIILILMVLLVVGGLWYLGGGEGQLINSIDQAEEQSKKKEPVASKPTFFIGDVSVVGPDSLTVVSGEKEMTVVVDNNTKFIHQVRDDDGYTSIPTTLKDLTQEMKAAVFYTESGGVYTATSIQVVNF